MRNSIIGLIIGFSLAGNIYAYSLHTGKVVSVAAACASSEDADLINELKRGMK
jgi:hypothetical protein